jgi:hypothetical protein
LPNLFAQRFSCEDQLEGPAVIEEIGATILIYPGDKMVNDAGHDDRRGS